MALHPVLPVIEGESLSTYLTRAAWFHGGRDVYGFLSFIELSRQDVIAPTESVLARISSLTGLDPATLAGMTFVRHGDRMRSIRGEVVHAEFANLDQTTFCPACLLEDGRPDSSSGGIRIGRVAWQIEAVRSCPKHGIGLQRRKNVSHSEKFQLMSEVAPDDRGLEALVASSERREPSALQDYVLRRLGGTTGPGWLDGQPIDLAVRGCEMLGVVVSVGTHPDLRKLTQGQWSQAGETGYRFACRGGEGIREGLQLVFDRFVREGKTGGPQKALGRLYQWLQFRSDGKPFGSIRGVVREFILDTFPIEAGTDLFGEPVDRQRVHSCHSLARKTGEHPKTINRAVVLAGLLDADPMVMRANQTFDADRAEALVRRIQDSIPVSKLPAHLNCNRVQAQQLVWSGHIPRLVEDGDQRGVLKSVAREDADAFLNRLLGQATRVEALSPGLHDIVAAAEISRWPVMDILDGILEGLFPTVEVLDPELKFKGIMVAPDEIRVALSQQKADGCIGIDAAARMLGMNTFGVSTLVKLRGRAGEVYLTERFVTNAKGVQTRVFVEAEIETFLRDHVRLADFAAARSFSVKMMKRKLDAKGIGPIASCYGLGRLYYRKADLQA
ncbi:hypothetical protein D1114_20765 [Cereibacter sphaeroides]|uniref:TniQ domain-containing protein n=1 Tax=Cereibacter sphaeroides TaxID=1063 RepID=A0AAX1UFH9_CERSP|nr:TniQ family protein [Cereibacter sphaeroides]RHZ91192.1 hypothetical protein D1114_20765 [Cereibacter sphaeroides]